MVTAMAEAEKILERDRRIGIETTASTSSLPEKPPHVSIRNYFPELAEIPTGRWSNWPRSVSLAHQLILARIIHVI